MTDSGGGGRYYYNVGSNAIGDMIRHGPDQPEGASWSERLGFYIRKGIMDTIRPGNHTVYSIKCEDTLSVCFEKHRVKVFQEKNVSDEDFFEFLFVVAGDVDRKKRGINFPYERADYDTPFYHGGFDDLRIETICVNSRCDSRGAINYVAQGMISAKNGESLITALTLVENWNQERWNHSATESELYWTEYGYRYFEIYRNVKYGE